MKTTFVFGHKKPDTDSVCSAIALANLKNELGTNAMPRVLGTLNNETKFALNYFQVEEPVYLNDVKLQIRDIDYGKNIYCDECDSLYAAISMMKEEKMSALPVINHKHKFLGLLSMKDITNDLISWDNDTINTSYENIINTIHGEKLLQYDDEIQGNVLVASYRSTTFIKDVTLDSSSILIVGDRHSIIEYAVEAGVKLIIITGDNIIKDEHVEIAKKNHVNIIRTPLRTLNVVRVISMCNYTKTLMDIKDIITVQEKDYVKDFIEVANQYRYTIYPVLNQRKECLGVVQLSDTVHKHKKRVILVDHNEKEQSVDGLDEAEIVEIVDHHKIGTIGTSQPINFRNMTLGCTSSIIYLLYRENKVSISREIAGILLSAILSDTLLFRSPTTTELDKEIAYNLSQIAQVDIERYGIEMLKAGSSLKDKTPEDILFTDFKTFTEGATKIGVGQINTLNIEEIDNISDELLDTINREANNHDYDILALFVTDIIKEGSYIYYKNGNKEILEKAFDIENLNEGDYVPGIISRKKQVIPNIIRIVEDK